MPDVGVRELKARASEIIRNVRERRARYVITYRGRPVGLLMPVDEARALPLSSADELATTAWEELTRLGEGDSAAAITSPALIRTAPVRRANSRP